MLLNVLQLMFRYHAIHDLLVSKLSIEVFSRKQAFSDAWLEGRLNLFIDQRTPHYRTESRVLFYFIPIALTPHPCIRVSDEESLDQVFREFRDWVSRREPQFSILDELVHQLYILVVEGRDAN